MASIYFACSIRGYKDRADVATYSDLIAHISKTCKVKTEIFGDGKLTAQGDKDSHMAYERDMKMLMEADAVIAEVTIPSLGVGYEIAKAESQGKKILCLYRPEEGRRLSAMLQGNRKLTVNEYSSLEEAKGHIDNFLKGI